MSEEDHKIPTTVKELGIHIGYIRKDIADLKQIIKDMRAEAVGRVEFEEYKKNNAIRHVENEERITKLETNAISSEDWIEMKTKVDKRPWVLTSLSALLGAVMVGLISLVFSLWQALISHT